eukprot:SAG31_NODE_1142_length_9696_cov_3.874232_13_plen_30_part_00
MALARSKTDESNEVDEQNGGVWGRGCGEL